MLLRTATPLVLVALAAAQSPSPAKPAAAATNVTGIPQVAPDLGSELLVDTTAEGDIWVAGASYKACFGPTKVQFLPFLGSDLPSNQPLELTLESVRLAGTPLTLWDTAPRLNHNSVDYERGACRESYHISTDGIEQVFTFATLPQRGDLSFSIRVTTPLAGQTTSDGLRFAHERGYVRYTTAVAIDGKGRRLSLPTHLDGNQIHFAVPAAFVAEASLPLVVDPVIGTIYEGPSLPYQIIGKDLAYDASANEWQVVWSYPFSQSDFDLRAQRFDGNWTPLASNFAIDLTGDSWSSPSIANLAFYDKFLVVAHKQVGSSSRIAGRITQAGSNTPSTAQFEIEGPGATGNLGRPASHPDVGGDPSLSPPTYWTVVYQIDNGNNHDIYARQVTEAGVLRNSAPTAIAATNLEEIQPRISKSNGRGSIGSQAWGIVYNHNFWQIRGRSLTWNGTVVGPTQLLFSGINNQSNFDISSPTDDQNGQRQMLLTFEYVIDPIDSTDVCGVLVDRAMNPIANPISLSALSMSSQQNARQQDQPSVDCDGRRFVVAYRHDFSAPDYDIRAAVFQQRPGVLGGLHCLESEWLSFSHDTESETKVCAESTGDGPRFRYGIVWQRALSPTSNRIEAATYGGYQSGVQISTRSTGCGNLLLNHSGSSLAGDTLTLQVGNGSGLVGMVVGLPAGAVIPGCGSCVQGAQGNTLLTNQYAMVMPMNAAFIGLTLSFQGFAIDVGPCLGQVSLSDTVDATIR